MCRLSIEVDNGRTKLKREDCQLGLVSSVTTNDTPPSTTFVLDLLLVENEDNSILEERGREGGRGEGERKGEREGEREGERKREREGERKREREGEREGERRS